MTGSLKIGLKRKSDIQSDSAKILILRNLAKIFIRIIKVKTNKIAKRVKANHLSTERVRAQLMRVYDCFMERPKTMLEVSIETGILRANICRYVAGFRKAGLIQVHHHGIDAITKCLACFLTTNPALFKKSVYNQQNLFE